MITVGISAFYHDAACVVLIDGRAVAAAQEERYTRQRYDSSLPINAFRSCLQEAGIGIGDVDALAYYEDPVLKLGRQIWMGLPQFPLATPQSMFRLDATYPYRQIRDRLGYAGPMVTVKHHEAHAASAFYFSGFPQSALLTADAVGEWTTMSYGRADDGGIELFEEVSFPHSLGLLYSTITSYLGFEVNGGEGKVMGLAPYGRPVYADAIRQLVDDLPGGQFTLALDYFDFWGSSEQMYSPRLADLLGVPQRVAEQPILKAHEDLAASVQVVTEDLLLAKARYLHDRTGSEFLGYAGGVALNCVANARLRSDSGFQDIFVPPAPGDAGGALGAAAIAHHRLSGSFTRHRLDDARLGPVVGTEDLASGLSAAGVEYENFAGRSDALLAETARLLAAGQVIGWFRGRMEFGPRALGSRSILADPRLATMRDHVNAVVKKREAFRPFAPAVVAERGSEFFELDRPSPFMLDTVQVRAGVQLPAVTHVDGSARVQTVERSMDPDFHGLLTEFGKITGYPILLNTSFNLRGEPIVCSPSDALVCFIRSGLDTLVVGELLLRRDALPVHWEGLVESVMPSLDQVISRDVYALL